MIKKTASVLAFIFVFSCAEKLMEKPENLIPKDKMVLILEDLTILNAAKSTNAEILRKHKIDPMDYIFSKYGIDSIRFMESDFYYASLPAEYEIIYSEVEARLEKEKDRVAQEKRVNDSLKTIEREAKRKQKKTIDSLQ